MKIFALATLRYWHFPVLSFSSTGIFQYRHFPVLSFSSTGNFQYCHFPVPAFSVPAFSSTGIFQYCHFPVPAFSSTGIFQYRHFPVPAFSSTGNFQYCHFPVLSFSSTGICSTGIFQDTVKNFKFLEVLLGEYPLTWHRKILFYIFFVFTYPKKFSFLAQAVKKGRSPNVAPTISGGSWSLLISTIVQSLNSVR